MDHCQSPILTRASADNRIWRVVLAHVTVEIRWDENAGLLYLLRFERVDNLGAYRIPPETGILMEGHFTY